MDHYITLTGNEYKKVPDKFVWVIPLLASLVATLIVLIFILILFLLSYFLK